MNIATHLLEDQRSFRWHLNRFELIVQAQDCNIMQFRSQYFSFGWNVSRAEINKTLFTKRIFNNTHEMYNSENQNALCLNWICLRFVGERINLQQSPTKHFFIIFVISTTLFSHLHLWVQKNKNPLFLFLIIYDG